MTDETILSEGCYLALHKKGNWEYTIRPNSTGAVGILPVTNDGKIILVEQHRIPVRANVIEIPAGLVGDEAEFADENLADCARRELLEETGYRADSMQKLLSSPASAGMTTEITHLFCATQLHREHNGGGTDSEDITVHHVRLDEIDDWLTTQEEEGTLVDFKIHACLWLARSQGLLDID